MKRIQKISIVLIGSILIFLCCLFEDETSYLRNPFYYFHNYIRLLGILFLPFSLPTVILGVVIWLVSPQRKIRVLIEALVICTVPYFIIFIKGIFIFIREGVLGQILSIIIEGVPVCLFLCFLRSKRITNYKGIEIILLSFISALGAYYFQKSIYSSSSPMLASDVSFCFSPIVVLLLILISELIPRSNIESYEPNIRKTRRTISVKKKLAITILPVIGFFIVLIGYTLKEYKGICYGFTDGQSYCSVVEFLKNNLFWALLLFSPVVFFWIVACSVFIPTHEKVLDVNQKSILISIKEIILKFLKTFYFNIIYIFKLLKSIVLNRRLRITVLALCLILACIKWYQKRNYKIDHGITIANINQQIEGFACNIILNTEERELVDYVSSEDLYSYHRGFESPNCNLRGANIDKQVVYGQNACKLMAFICLPAAIGYDAKTISLAQDVANNLNLEYDFSGIRKEHLKKAALNFLVLADPQNTLPLFGKELSGENQEYLRFIVENLMRFQELTNEIKVKLEVLLTNEKLDYYLKRDINKTLRHFNLTDVDLDPGVLAIDSMSDESFEFSMNVEKLDRYCQSLNIENLSSNAIVFLQKKKDQLTNGCAKKLWEISLVDSAYREELFLLLAQIDYKNQQWRGVVDKLLNGSYNDQKILIKLLGILNVNPTQQISNLLKIGISQTSYCSDIANSLTVSSIHSLNQALIELLPVVDVSIAKCLAQAIYYRGIDASLSESLVAVSYKVDFKSLGWLIRPIAKLANSSEIAERRILELFNHSELSIREQTWSNIYFLDNEMLTRHRIYELIPNLPENQQRIAFGAIESFDKGDSDLRKLLEVSKNSQIYPVRRISIQKLKALYPDYIPSHSELKFMEQHISYYKNKLVKGKGQGESFEYQDKTEDVHQLIKANNFIDEIDSTINLYIWHEDFSIGRQILKELPKFFTNNIKYRNGLLQKFNLTRLGKLIPREYHKYYTISDELNFYTSQPTNMFALHKEFDTLRFSDTTPVLFKSNEEADIKEINVKEIIQNLPTKQIDPIVSVINKIQALTSKVKTLSAEVKIFNEEQTKQIAEGKFFLVIPKHSRLELIEDDILGRGKENKIEIWKDRRLYWSITRQNYEEENNVYKQQYDEDMSINWGPYIDIPSNNSTCDWISIGGRIQNSEYNGDLKFEKEDYFKMEKVWILSKDFNSSTKRYFISQDTGFIVRDETLSKAGALGKPTQPIIEYENIVANKELDPSLFSYVE